MQLGAELVYTKRFADHHRFTQQEVLNAVNRSKKRQAAAIITTTTAGLLQASGKPRIKSIGSTKLCSQSRLTAEHPYVEYYRPRTRAAIS